MDLTEVKTLGMKRCNVFILIALVTLLMQCQGGVFAQTNVSGDVLSNTTWGAAGSPYMVTGNVRVVSGVTLAIEAGVEVRFAAQTRMDVEGMLSVGGTALDSVLFVADAVNPDTGSWGGIKVHGSAGGQVAITYARFAHASRALESDGMASGNGNVLENADFRRCGRGLAGWQGGLGMVRNCEFKENYIAVEYSALGFRRCAFGGNAYGLLEVEAGVDSCTFTKHTAVAISGGSGFVRQSLFVSNTIGLLLFGLTPLDSVNGCQFAENDTAAVDMSLGVAYRGNEFCANVVNVRMAGPGDADFERNCWCSLDTNFILATLLDGRTMTGLGRVIFTPIDTSCPVLTQVWPGDANDDGVATIADMLYLGVAYGSTGAVRAEATASWSGQAGLPWDLNFDFGTNYKHADCNGDGFVDLADTLPIVQNLGEQHYKTSGTSTHGGVPVIFEMPARAVGGDAVTVNVRIGDSQHPAVGVYGLAFVLRPDSNFVRPQSMQTDLTGSWLGTPGQDLMDLEIQNGRLHWGVVRNDQTDVSGSGRMGGVTMIMIDDLTRWVQVDSALGIEDVVLIDKKGNTIPAEVQIQLVYPNGGLDFVICPSPANGRMQLLLDTLEASRIDIYGQNGLLGMGLEGPLSGTVEVDTRELQPGLYYVRVTLARGVVTRKLFVLR